jgi:aminoglycoside phosphotransferase
VSPAPGVLELLLPAGRAGRIVVLGRGGPAALVPPPRGASGPIDLAVVAPSRAELREAGWLDSALVRAGALAPDGLLVALLPPAARHRAAALLRGVGLEPAREWLHRSRGEGDAGIVPLEPGAMAAIFGTLLPLGGLRRSLWRTLSRVPSATRIIARVHPAVILTARRPGAAGLAAWVREIEPSATGMAVRAKRRGKTGSIVVRCLGPSERTAPFFKLATAGAAVDEPRMRRIADRLACLGDGARAAGARLPEARVVTTSAGLTVLVESRVAGETAESLLQRRALTPSDAVRRLAPWLERWHAATAVECLLDDARLEAEVLRPAAAVAPALTGGAEYQGWLRTRCRELIGMRVRLVATHGDLTMSNVLLDRDEAPGVVDWEAARPDGLPLRDLWYAAADAEAAPRRYRDRAGAWEQSLAASGATGRLVADTTDRIRHALGLSPEFVTLCRHACWLQHAADEGAKRAQGEPRPFLAILTRLAAERAA